MRPRGHRGYCDRAIEGGSLSEFRHLETLHPLGFGVLRIKENIHPISVVFEVSADVEGGDAAAANRPEAEQC